MPDCLHPTRCQDSLYLIFFTQRVAKTAYTWFSLPNALPRQPIPDSLYPTRCQDSPWLDSLYPTRCQDSLYLIFFTQRVAKTAYTWFSLPNALPRQPIPGFSLSNALPRQPIPDSLYLTRCQNSLYLKFFIQRVVKKTRNHPPNSINQRVAKTAYTWFWL